MDQIGHYYRRQPYVPTLRFVNSYPDTPSYAQWYANRLETMLTEQSADLVAMSYHSVPDHPSHWPHGYRDHCERTTTAIMAEPSRCGITIAAVNTYRSTFGPGRWMTPTTVDAMRKRPGRGIKDVVVATPEFLTDCLETIEEIGDQNR